ncbi:MAG: hypothetical protein GF390_00670 [Candidatus Pacebacteria bacterium]|nr:hypothetical protein [Candidatus Paceibacterota bacterium]
MPRIRSYHFHLPQFSFDHSRDLKLLYGIRIFRSLIGKLAMFFLPLFLFQLGPQVNWFTGWGLSEFQQGVVMIAGYYVLARSMSLLTAIPIGKLVIKTSHQLAFLFSHLLHSLVFIGLIYAPTQPAILLLVAIIDGIQINFIWNSYHSLLSFNALKKTMGQDLGLLRVLLNLIYMISPALGGLLVVLAGYQSLFMVSLFFELIGVICALLMNSKKLKDQISWQEFWSWLQEKRFVSLGFSFVGRYFHDATLVVWPLYVFLLLGQVDRVGYLYSLSLFLAMMVSLFMGWHLDHHKSRKPFLLSGGILSILWIIRSFIFNIWSIAIVDMIDKLTGNFHWLFYDRALFNRGKGSQAYSYFVYREMIVSATAVVFWTVFALLFIVFPLGWRGLFGLAAIGVALSLLVREQSH